MSFAGLIHDLPGMEQLRECGSGRSDICIAVIDGPADLTHPALCSAQIEVLPGDPAAVRRDTALRHGTAVAGIIFGAIAAGCRGLLAPVFEAAADASQVTCSQFDLARAILQCVEAGAHVINISGGHFSESGEAHPILADAVRFAASRNVLVIAATGNDGCHCLRVPASLPTVLAVGAMDDRGQPMSLSNWSEQYGSRGILAPGANLAVAAPGGGFEPRSGTSYATAIVSGVAGLLLSLMPGRADAAAVRTILLETASCPPGPRNPRFLAGRLDLGRALARFVAASPRVIAADGSSAESVAAADCGCRRPVSETEGARQQSTCECGGSAPAQLVYALGSLGYDFGSETRRDSIAQQMGATGGGSPDDPLKLLDYLKQNPWDAQAIVWVLLMDGTPVYAIRPQGAFAAEGYARLQEILREQVGQGADRVSVPGIVTERARLLSGQSLPVIIPDLRCLYNWNTKALLDSIQTGNSGTPTELESFLERIYFELRNLGILPQDRALNFAATNAMNAAKVFEAAAKDHMQLDTIQVERSPVCRPGAECWDVKLTFFDAERQVERARKVYRFTVDVSDICPVMIGQVRAWSVR